MNSLDLLRDRIVFVLALQPSFHIGQPVSNPASHHDCRRQSTAIGAEVVNRLHGESEFFGELGGRQQNSRH